MNCFNHQELSAVAQCQDCNKGLCNDCAKQYTIPICSVCNSARFVSEKNQIIKEFFLTFGLGLILTILMYKLMTHKELSKDGIVLPINLILLTSFYGGSGLVAGWRTLNRITPRFFLFLPLIGWIIYFYIKILLSYWVGLIMLPVRTVRNIRRLKEINTISY